MKQQAISILDEEIHQHELWGMDSYVELLQQCKSKIKSLPGNEWIISSIKPEEGFYLTYNTIGAIFETYYHPHTGWCTGGSIKETEITHYQPLINPPNK